MEDNEFDEIFEFDVFQNLTISQLDKFINRLQELRNDKFRDQYVVVEVVNMKGNISETIKKETGFHTYWRPVTQTFTGYCGTNKIVIPKEKYTDELEKELKLAYDI